MRPLRQYLALLRHFGLGWLLHRTAYAMRRRTGLLRRASPITIWENVPVPALQLSLRASPAIPAVWGATCVDEAEAILKGAFRLFSHRQVDAGFPPEWHRNQLTGERVPADWHWSELGDFAFGDIKGVWELSRFPWAFPLVRAFGRTGDKRYPAVFWQLFGDWCRNNPPNQGPNWMCGQEATFRLMAVVQAVEAFGVPEGERMGLVRFLVATGRRIAANLGYALSQKNNHGVSECVGLITVALLLPEHDESDGWLSRGQRELRPQLAELVYEDGGFSQHSLIYHRVLLHDLCWCRRRLELAGQEVPAWLDAAATRALAFLMILTDPLTGLAPLYGPNDGANVLPLAESDFLDMRPVIQMTAAVFRRELPLPAGPWDEAAAWLSTDWESLPRASWPPSAERWHAPQAGCCQLVRGHDRLFLRCPTTFKHRPVQADMLHVDIQHEGLSIALDGGSFSYNSQERFTAMGSASQHNVLTVDAKEPLQKFSRFLYLPWPSGMAKTTDHGGFQASHDGYTGLGVEWTREVSPRTQGGGFIVRDKVTGAAGHALQWHWRLAHLPWKLDALGDRIETANYQVSWTGLVGGRARLLRADTATARGWWSPYYGSVEPATALLLETEAGADIELVTEFRLPD